MYLSANFTLDEFTNSQTAARLSIGNDPSPEMYDTLKTTAYYLELVRTELGNRAILISSGYRSAALNAAVGGAIGSQHLLGQAVDFTCPTYGSPDAVVRKLIASTIPFDQCIREFGKWVHISFTSRPRKQALIIDSTGTRPYASA